MPSKKLVTAVFDIGKTNKKLLFFDESLSVVQSTTRVFDEITDDDGHPCDDLESITAWLLGEVEKMPQYKEFEVTSVNFSAYGATLVHLDEEGKPITPLYNYLKPYPEEVLEEFYQKYGGKEEFSTVTASPPMGMLNSGLQIYWLKKKKPQLFSQIKTMLHFPQYLSYLLTGKSVSEKTSIGCHTGMWNFREDNYHRWLEDEEILKLLPEIEPVTKSFEAKIGDARIRAGIGIHDSSAALAPYLMAFDDPFILLSTGTWSIAMNPFTADSLTYEELKRDCLHYLNIYGNPVKASRFLLGGEYSHQLNKLGGYFGRNPDKFDCEPDIRLIKKMMNDSSHEKRLVLEKSQTSGPYPDEKSGEWNLSRFENYEEATHRCLLDLASIQADALKLAEGSGRIDKVILTGGFAKNFFFCRLLASMLPGKKLYTASLTDASALGAAILMKEPVPAEKLKNQLELDQQKPFEKLNLYNYSWASVSDHRKQSE